MFESRDRSLACIGTSDEEGARLRLMVRQAAARMAQAWRWTDADDADFVICDISTEEGINAMSSAIARGRLVAVLDEAEASFDERFVVPRDFRLGDVVRMLQEAGGRLSGLPAGFSKGVGDFFGDLDYSSMTVNDFADSSFLDQIPDARPSEVAAQVGVSDDEPSAIKDVVARAEARAAELLRNVAAVTETPAPNTLAAFAAAIPSAVNSPADRAGGARAEPPQAKPAPVTATPASPVAKAPEPAIKAATPAVAPVAPAPAPTPAKAPEPVVAKPSAAERARYPLLDYVRQGLIGVPSRIALANAPQIVLDPINKVFHAIGDLRALEPYFNELLSRTDWMAMTPPLLVATRREVPARPFDLLIWYVTLRGAQGKLAARLDPGGTYQLSRTLDLASDHPRAHRIAQAMQGPPRRLAEIATASSTSVAEVYEVVSAFDAIGYVSWQPAARGRSVR